MIQQISDANVAGHRVNAEVAIGIARVDGVTNCLASCEYEMKKRKTTKLILKNKRAEQESALIKQPLFG